MCLSNVYVSISISSLIFAYTERSVGEVVVVIDSLEFPPPQWDRMEAHMKIIAEATHKAMVEKEAPKAANQGQYTSAESSANSDITKASRALKRKRDCNAQWLASITEGSLKRRHKVPHN